MSSLSHSLSVDTQIALSIEIHSVNARSLPLSLHYKKPGTLICVPGSSHNSVSLIQFFE